MPRGRTKKETLKTDDKDLLLRKVKKFLKKRKIKRKVVDDTAFGAPSNLSEETWRAYSFADFKEFITDLKGYVSRINSLPEWAVMYPKPNLIEIWYWSPSHRKATEPLAVSKQKDARIKSREKTREQ